MQVLQAATETIKAKFNFSETTLQVLILNKLCLTTLNIAKIFFPVVFNIDFQVEEFQEGMNYCGPCKEL